MVAAANFWPQKLALSVFIRIKIEKGDLVPTEFRLELFHNNNKLAVVGGNIGYLGDGADQAIADGIIALPLSFPQLPLSGPGTINAKITLFRKDKEVISISPECGLAIVFQEITNN